MKKIIILAVIAIMGLMLSGCAGKTIQESINDYFNAREKVVNTSHIVKCEKDCIIECDTISNDIDRVDCKASCLDGCKE